ncbi:1-acyl-sn-glycerol-3-phosphate acyltransferase [Oligoflexus tunisiensis]|uniref:1-acyl-sn-glycerol-3-phosphate acyltransferase n=1 Tax=Oligoflexus tunisiensis TaxID=708132 RepID=UPI00114CD01B|nr:1-acyl-sn-glycerol-3-phosphate acyltransferase [Oligoflexus tunisiensis]
MYRNILSQVGRSIYALRGWTCEPLPPYWQKKQVIIGFPHTTIMDTVMAFSGFAIVKKKGHVLVRNQDFRWPYGGLLKKLGAIPVDRSQSTGLVRQMAEEFASRDEFHLALVPEGTRRGVQKIKTGFWHIAKEAKVPIVCWYLDNQNKRTIWAGQLIPGDSLEADLEAIRVMYQKVGFMIPGMDAPDAAERTTGH